MIEQLDNACPIYMNYGMSLTEYWDESPELAVYYRKAYELRRELENESMWLQGMYICEAVLHALNGRKSPYPKEPYPLKTEVSKKRAEAKQEQNERKVIDYMMTFAQQFNKRFEQEQSGKLEEMKRAGVLPPDAKEIV